MTRVETRRTGGASLPAPAPAADASLEMEAPRSNDMTEALKEWMHEKGLYWATSATAHFLLLSVAMLVLGAMYVAPKPEGTHPEFDEARVDTAPPVENFEIADTPIDPTELNTETLSMAPPTVTEQINTTPDDVFVEAGGGASAETSATAPGMSLDLKALGEGVKVKGAGGLGGMPSSGTGVGSGDKGEGFGGRGAGVRKAMLGSGGTKQSERAVAAALNWLARHQSPDGSWSLTEFIGQCKDGTCAGPGKIKSNPAATAMALLPFLAAGQTHVSKGPYQVRIKNGLYWLTTNQKPDGDLSGGSQSSQMYTHGLCTICLCEAYGLSRDRNIGAAAQLAIQFIERSQDPQGGGWRYTPRQAGDTSVVGWQVMALKSAHMAGLTVSTQTMEGAKRFLASCGNGQGHFGYMPGADGSPTMSAVGVLCSQYLGAPKTDPVVKGGQTLMMGNLPAAGARSVYYWYYATQVMHNLPGPEWDAWNRAMRRILIESQVNKGCAAGSWDLKGDHWGTEAGRIFETSLSCLTLEVYYRYLPLYKLDEGAKK